MEYVYILFKRENTGFPDIGGDLEYDDFQCPYLEFDSALVMLGQYGKVGNIEDGIYADVHGDDAGDVVAYVRRYRVRTKGE